MDWLAHLYWCQYYYMWVIQCCLCYYWWNKWWMFPLFVILIYSTIVKQILCLFSDLHIYNSFILIPAPNIRKRDQWGTKCGLFHKRPVFTFALAEASTYDEILQAIPTIKLFFLEWKRKRWVKYLFSFSIKTDINSFTQFRLLDASH